MIAPTLSIAALGNNASELVARHMDRVLRALLTGPTVVQDHRFLRLITGEPHPLGNFAFISDPSDLEATRAGVEPLLACSAPTAVIFPADASSAINDFLTQLGYGIPGSMPAMAVEIEQVTPMSLPDEYRFARVEDGPEAESWVDALANGYGLPRPLADMFSPVVVSGEQPNLEVHCYAALRDDTVVATSLLCMADGLAGIYCVATLPDERGKGLGTYMTAEPLRLAQQRGYRVGVLQSSDLGHPVYRRLGFRDLGTMPLYVRMPE